LAAENSESVRPVQGHRSWSRADLRLQGAQGSSVRRCGAPLQQWRVCARPARTDRQSDRSAKTVQQHPRWRAVAISRTQLNRVIIPRRYVIPYGNRTHWRR
jgi:hypothetical protein